MTTTAPPHLLDGKRWHGKRVGLLGGSFNPPHIGHVHISRIALHTLKLDWIWWLVTPQNPLKSADELLPLKERVRKSKELIKDPRILVTDIEKEMGVNRSYDTIKLLKQHFPQTDFAWLMGMDNAINFHKWGRWRDILDEVATVQIARPPACSLAINCPLKLISGQNHHYPQKSIKADLSAKNSYWIMQKHMLDISSTKIRNSCENR